MGVKITSTNTRAPWNTRVLPPVTRGLAGWFDLDTEVRRGAFNRALGGNAAKVVGLPVAAPTHLTMSLSTGYIDTDIHETLEFTAFWLFRTQTLSAFVGGTYNGLVNQDLAPPNVGVSSSYGTTVWIQESGTVMFTGCRVSATGGVTSAGRSPNSTFVYDKNWMLGVNRVTATTHSVFDKTRGWRNDGSSLLARVPSLSPLRIGATTGTISSVPAVDVSQLIIYNTALTDDEIDQIVAVMRKRAARLGIAA